MDLKIIVYKKSLSMHIFDLLSKELEKMHLKLM